MQSLNLKIGFIGFGNMAQCIYKGLFDAGVITNTNCYLSNKKANESLHSSPIFGLSPSTNQEVSNQSDIIIFCVKPNQIKGVLSNLNISENKIIISILAGTPLSVFQSHFPDANCFRVMPNTPCKLGKGVSAIVSENNSKYAESVVFSLFNAIGKTISISEDQMHLMTALTGSGPAFFYKICEIFADYASKNGIDSQDAIRLITQTMAGAAEMLNENDHDVTHMIKMVRSPGGTTAAGLDKMDDSLSNKMHTVLDAASNRSQELFE